MLPCPICNRDLQPSGPGQWVRCPSCTYWASLQVDSGTNTVWLQPGIQVNNRIEPIQLAGAPQNRAVAVGAARAGSNSLQQAVPVQQPSLSIVRSQRTSIRTQLRTIEAEMKRLGSNMGVNSENTDALRRNNQAFNDLSARERTLRQQDRDLAQQETALQAEEERRRAEAAAVAARTNTNASNDNPGWAFISASFVVAAALFAFGKMLGLHWTPSAVLYMLGIAVVGGVLIWIVNL